MPTYVYECSNPAHHRFEKFQSFSEPPVAECPSCGASVRRVIYPAGVIFKGPGFYKTDNAPNAATASGDDKPAEDGKAEKPVEGTAKPADGAKAPAEAKKPDDAKAESSKPAASAAE